MDETPSVSLKPMGGASNPGWGRGAAGKKTMVALRLSLLLSARQCSSSRSEMSLCLMPACHQGWGGEERGTLSWL
jgi:hypothetical protein